MAEQSETNYDLWKQFNLGERNPAKGGGILYCMRYSKDRLEAHQEQVIGALKEMGATIADVGNGGIGLSLGHVADGINENAVLLLEELSVLNEALEYHQAGFGACKSFGSLKNRFISGYFELLDRDKVSAYDFVDLGIPLIMRDIAVSANQGKKLKAHERKTLQELGSFASRQVELHNRPGGFVIIGA